MFFKELNDVKMRSIVILLLLLVSLAVTIALRPYTETMFSQMISEFEKLPKFMKKIIGSPEQLTRLKDDEYYLISQWHGKNLGQFLPLLSLLIAFPIFAKENEKKTIYFLLARKKRKFVFWVKFLTGLFVLLIMTGGLSTMGFVLMKILGHSVSLAHLLPCLISEMVGVTFFFSLFLLFSIISNDQVKPVIAGIVILIGLPLLSLIKSVSFLNPYPYILCVNVLDKGIDWPYTIVLASVSLLLIVSDYLVFKNREF